MPCATSFTGTISASAPCVALRALGERFQGLGQAKRSGTSHLGHSASGFQGWFRRRDLAHSWLLTMGCLPWALSCLIMQLEYERSMLRWHGSLTALTRCILGTRLCFLLVILSPFGVQACQSQLSIVFCSCGAQALGFNVPHLSNGIWPSVCRVPVASFVCIA